MLLCITGSKGSGKDEFAKIFTQKNFLNIKFADPLKEMLRTLYRVASLSEVDIERRLEGDLKETPDDIICGETPRWAMQSLGTEWRDMIHRTLWSNIWRNRVAPLLKEGAPVVCTDVRFHHEVAVIRDLGGHLIRIDRPGYGLEDNHSSETEMQELQVDATISNIGSIRQLHTKAQAYLKEIT